RVEWEERIAAMDPAKREVFDRLMEGRLPEGWEQAALDYKKAQIEEQPERPGIRTSGEISRVLSHAIPEFVGGAPDLEAATQHKRDMRPFTPQDRGGRYIHYGVREHAMGAMINGMLSHGGVVPFGTTFLVFSDYMRHAIRLSAMMSLPAIWVFSHDSVGIGTNGPTHQPVECLASLRAIPNLNVFRPGDPVEAAECWMLAVADRGRPSAMTFSRQAIPTLRQEYSEENLCARGAYVLAEADGGPASRRVTLMATGSEVSLAMKARDLLQAEGIPTAVVSMPCWELFEEQDKDYREKVLGTGSVRVAVEAAVRLGWDRYLGEEGGFVGMASFGASGQPADLFEHFGITPKAVMEAAKARLR
ncbi:MAG: transketolase, partial [Rhodospirillales bacterium]|nr:transketolase [Rhodospirillales bacterium]